MIFLLQLLHCDVVFVVLGNGFRTGFVVSRIDMAEVAVLAEICQLLLTHLMINGEEASRLLRSESCLHRYELFKLRLKSDGVESAFFMCIYTRKRRT